MTPMTKALMGLIHAYAEAHGADMSNVPASNEASAALKAALAQQVEQAKPAAPADHEVRELVNRLTAIAREFHGTQQLRERIANEVRPFTFVKPALDEQQT